MNYLQYYHIPYTGLKLGQHIFEYEIDKRFFDEFEYSIVKDGKLKLSVTLDKQETLMIANFDIKGFIYLDCDLCLSSFPAETAINERAIIKFSEHEDISEDTEEILILSKKDHELDISPLIYEYINVAVPFNSRCDDPGNKSTCDVEMIDKINSLSIHNKESEQQSIDPRWEVLNKIKKK